MEQFVIEAAVTSVLCKQKAIYQVISGDWSSAVGSAELMGEALTVAPTPFAVLMAFGISAGIGVLFGYLPAKKAARLNPIDALHYD